MEHKIINTGTYLLIVDDSEIKEGDWCIDIYKLKNNHNPIFKWSNKFKVDAKKIIAHLPLNNSPILEGVPLLPPLEDEVEKLAQNIHYDMAQQGLDANGCFNQYQGFKAGYNKAKERYKYTEEDVRRAYMKGKHGGITESYSDIDKLIQSLQQPKIPVMFKCEMEKPSSSFGAHMANFFGQSIPKTITNSQGLIQWVGEYIYD